MTFFILWTLAKMRNSEMMWILVFNACTFAKNAHFCNMMDSFKLLNIFFRIQIDELIRTCQLFEYCLNETWGLASFPALTTRLFKQIYISITLFTNFTDEQLLTPLQTTLVDETKFCKQLSMMKLRTTWIVFLSSIQVLDLTANYMFTSDSFLDGSFEANVIM